MYVETTRNIEVTARPMFLPDQSSPVERRFVWAYQIRIANRGRETVQLINRYWKITDAEGRVHEVRGAGVVGEQPTLAPGQTFEYISGTPLGTPTGFMVGQYEMETERGERFHVAIPPFSLDSPHQAVRLH